jgi:hypothetical protein
VVERQTYTLRSCAAISFTIVLATPAMLSRSECGQGEADPPALAEDADVAGGTPDLERAALPGVPSTPHQTNGDGGKQ